MFPTAPKQWRSWLSFAVVLGLAVTQAGSSAIFSSAHKVPAARSGQAQAQTYLAQSYWQQERRADALHYWTQAAEALHLPAIKALQKHFPKQHEYWRKLAARAGDASAQALLKQNALTQRQQRLRQETARQLQQAEDLNEITRIINQLPKSEMQFKLLQGLELITRAQASDCQTNLVVVAPDGTDRFNLFNLLAEFRQHALADLPWCMALRFAEFSSSTAIGQQVKAADPLQIIISEPGRAYATDDALYLPSSAGVDLLAHELAHLTGLADEYPMRTELAENFCAGRYRHASRNIVITDSLQVTESELKQLWERLPWRDYFAGDVNYQMLATEQGNGQWQLGSTGADAVGLFAAKTCKNSQGIAWKPVAETTAMEHFDIPYWPPLYLQLMETELLERNRRLRDHKNRAEQGEKPN